MNQLGGDPLGGVKVSAYNAPSIFTLTDANGEYKLSLPDEIQKLQFSYAGMQTKVVKIGEFNTVNILLIPSNYKKFRFGLGSTIGSSVFSVSSDPDIHFIDTTASINMGTLSFNANFIYRINKSFNIQSIADIDFNKLNYTDTANTEQIGVLIVSSLAVPINYTVNLGRTGNSSLFFGAGPRFNYLSTFRESSLGLIMQSGVSLNNYGRNTKLSLIIDLTGGTVKNFETVQDFIYQYSSYKLGVTVFF
ncbi:MAG: carboxypeptidase-like regulatory domain-containing protein [Bacteroidota bacterium]|nr:carboxypeptidase-like regulatory domain-containing protein [Bacteroidota bacterium]